MRRALLVIPAVGLGLVACGSAPQTTVLRGRLSYEYREVRADLSGLGPVSLAPAAGLPFEVRAGHRLLAHGTTGTGSDAGKFAARVPAPLPAAARIVFTAAVLDGRGLPRLGVARAVRRSEAPDSPAEERRSPGLWEWSFPAVPRAHVIHIGDGSGALRLLDTAAFTIGFAARTYPHPGPTVKVVPTLAILWAPGALYPCFACFEDAAGAGVTVGGRKFESVIWLDGSESLAQAWTESVLGHELGHWVMAVYGLLPEDDHEHTLTERLSPQTAWLEGWATFFGQVVRSRRRGHDDPRVVALADGVGYALDLASGRYVDATLPRERLAPIVPRAGMAQEIAEGEVARMLWTLRGVCGEPAVLLGIAEPRMTGPKDRGAKGKDLVDFLDALLCSGRVTRNQIDAVVKERFGFPYDGKPLCPIID